MNANDYQAEARRTLIDAPDSTFNGTELMLMWCALGLGGEAGEVLDLLKKGICHQHGLDRLKIKEELGDLMWYVASIATLCEIDLGTILESNAAKLRQRYPNGYNSADSQARVDQQIPDLPWAAIGNQDTCKMCGQPIIYVHPYWDHPGEIKPRHPATPVRYRL